MSRETPIQIDGRILYLTENEDQLKAQLYDGENLPFDADRDVWALFAELAIPIGETIDVQLAARFEEYGGEIGSTFDPKLAVRWQATDALAFRTSVASSARVILKLA